LPSAIIISQSTSIGPALDADEEDDLRESEKIRAGGAVWSKIARNDLGGENGPIA
jgi:hypothetical protein